MRVYATVVLFCGILLGHLEAQSTPPASAPAAQGQAIAFANAANVALAGSTQVVDGTLTGTAIWPRGSDKYTGAATFQFKGTSQSRMDLALGSFLRSEIWNDVDANVPDGEFTDESGSTRHYVAHNRLAPPNWFSPVSFVRLMLHPNSVVIYAGSEVQNGIAVDHLQVILSRGKPTSPTKLSALIQLLSTVDVYLDKNSHLPWSIKYNTHPDNDFLVDIPVEIRFANYRSIQGVMIPFRLQRLIQGNLNLDFTVTNAAINAGVDDSGFALQ